MSDGLAQGAIRGLLNAGTVGRNYIQNTIFVVVSDENLQPYDWAQSSDAKDMCYKYCGWRQNQYFTTATFVL